MNIDIVDKVSGGDNTFIIEEIDGENDGRFGIFKGGRDDTNFDFMFEARFDKFIEGFFMHDNKLRIIGAISNHFYFDIIGIVKDRD